MARARIWFVVGLVTLVLASLSLPSLAAAAPAPKGHGLGLVPSRGELPRADLSRWIRPFALLPSVVDLSAGLPPVDDQGPQSSCVGWALGYYYKTLQEGAERGWDVRLTQHQFSPAWIYNQRPADDCSRDLGMSYYAGLMILRDLGAATLSAFPYNFDDTCTQPSQAVADAALTYRAQGFGNIFAIQGDANLDTLKNLLASGQAFALAVPVYSSFFAVTYDDPIVQRHSQNESYYGGHALIIVGYDESMMAFKAVNSWGPSFGRDGFVYLSYDFVSYDSWEAWVMYDEVQPQPAPSRFWGRVATTHGQPVSAGSQVVAWVGGTIVAQSTVTVANGTSSYAIAIPADNPATQEIEGGQPGSAIRFMVGTKWAAETATWQTGANTNLNLTLPGEPPLGAPSLWIANFGRLAGGWSSQNSYPRALGDVNGDGNADVVGFGGAGAYVSLSDGADFGAATRWVSNFGALASGGGWTNQNTYPRTLADANGDGKLDVVGFGAAGVYVSLSSGANFGSPSLWAKNYGTSSSAGGWTSHEQYPRLLADVNGDGKADVVGFGALGAYVALSNGTSFGTATRWAANYGAAPAGGGWTSQNTYPRALADVNGDGKADIVGFGGAGTYVSLSNGSAFGTATLWVRNFGAAPTGGGWTSQNQFPRTLADMNGDGKCDIAAFGASGVYVSLSTGSSFGTPRLWLAQYGYSATAGGWSSQDALPRIAADVDGDRMADIVGFGDVGTFVSLDSVQALPLQMGAVANAPVQTIHSSQTQSPQPKPQSAPALPVAKRDGAQRPPVIR